MSPRSSLTLVALFALLGAPAAAQTGPFADGELLVRFPLPATGVNTLSRVNAATGATAPLLTGLYDGYTKSGWMTYDGYRGGVLAYTSLESLGIFAPRLILIRANGSVADLGQLQAEIQAMASAGDGRVYLRKGGVLHLLDANHQLTPVLNAGQPVTLPFEQMLFDQAQNALLGVPRGSGGTNCNQFNHVTVYRLPLTADGKSIAPGIACGSLDIQMPDYEPVGMDRLPGGDVLITLADGFFSAKQMVRLQPLSMAITVFAEPAYSDIDGGVWAQSIDRAVILEDFTNTLRSFVEAEQGPGTPISTAALGPDGFTGYGVGNKMTDVNVIGPVCGGDVLTFGTGLAGTNGVVPGLGAANCPAIGKNLPLVVSSGIAAPAIVGLSLNSAAYPLFGGTGYLVPPIVAQIPVATTIAVGSTAFGQVLVPIPPTPGLVGVHVFGQAAVVDAGAPQGLALSRPVGLVIGG